MKIILKKKFSIIPKDGPRGGGFDRNQREGSYGGNDRYGNYNRRGNDRYNNQPQEKPPSAAVHGK